MKLIFLDFDGVIVTPKTRFNNVDADCMQWLSRLVWECDAHIVVTSTWRKGNSLDFLRGVLGRWVLNNHVIGSTSALDHRGKEIKKWIEDNSDIDIESIVVFCSQVRSVSP